MGFLEDRDLSSVPSITEFFKGKTIFITGGSGFMGKVLIEKLLYSCSDLDKIYLLVRNKKGVNSEDRLALIYSSRCFDRLRQEKPNIFASKVFIVAGDVMEISLGLSEEDRTLLINRVNIVFHVAASVRFNDTLDYAVKMNLRGTKMMVELAREMRDLAVFVHVSTSYSNTNRDPIEEIMYPPHADVEETLNICENVDEHTLKVFTPKYLGKVPNTYAFSKQLAEHVVYKNKGQLPAIIMRPSIVISSYAEPVPGWIENFNGPVALIAAAGKGILRSVYSDPDLIADYIPVDISIKSFIVAAWIRGTKNLEPTDDVPIYNCCAGKINNITAGRIIELGREIVSNYPTNGALWHVGGDISTSKTLNYIQVILFHVIPAIIVDILLRVLGRKPMLLKVQRRIYIATTALEYYTTKQWTFDNKNFVKLRSCVKDEDLKSFYYEMETIDQNKFFHNAVMGGRRYLLNERDEDLPKARVHYKRMYYLDKIVRCVFFGYLLWWFINLGCVQNVLNQLSAVLF